MFKGALKIILLVAIIAAIVIAIILVKKAEAPTQSLKDSAPIASIFPQSKNMKLTSTAFGNNENIPAKFTCEGENINPPLEINEVPAGAKSLVIIVDDPDAPTGDWVHWTVWKIKPDTKGISEDSIPAGAVEGMTDFGEPGYGGPCPPSGTHRYQFKIFALDTLLNLAASAKKQDIETAMEGHILDQAMLVGLYQGK